MSFYMPKNTSYTFSSWYWGKSGEEKINLTGTSSRMHAPTAATSVAVHVHVTEQWCRTGVQILPTSIHIQRGWHWCSLLDQSWSLKLFFFFPHRKSTQKGINRFKSGIFFLLHTIQACLPIKSNILTGAEAWDEMLRAWRMKSNRFNKKLFDITCLFAQEQFQFAHRTRPPCFIH